MDSVKNSAGGKFAGDLQLYRKGNKQAGTLNVVVDMSNVPGVVKPQQAQATVYQQPQQPQQPQVVMAGGGGYMQQPQVVMAGGGGYMQQPMLAPATVMMGGPHPGQQVR